MSLMGSLIIWVIFTTINHSVISSKTENCSVNCFFTDDVKEFLSCSKKESNHSNDVKVSCSRPEELSIGSLESIRSVNRNFLADLPLVKSLTLNLHLMDLEPDVLVSENLVELKVSYVEKVNQKSFINLPRLGNIDFGKTGTAQLPEFFIVKHKGNNQITTVNIDMECYKCQNDSKELLVFPTKPNGMELDLYTLQTIDIGSCSVKLELQYCNNSNLENEKYKEKLTHRSLKLENRLNQDNLNKYQNDQHISMFYISLIICLVVVALVFCLLMLQLWTICKLRMAIKILKSLQFNPAMMNSEFSDNNESSSYFGTNGTFYPHNFPRLKS